MSMTEVEPTQVYALAHVVEPRRRERRIPLRVAAAAAGMSEGTWRQLVAGGLYVQGRWVPRHPKRTQVMAMAYAVDCFDDCCKAIDATTLEIREVRESMNFTSDPAETEIMRMRFLKAAEKIALLEALAVMRETGA